VASSGPSSGQSTAAAAPARLAETGREASSVADYGGEELGVILPGAELADPKELTEPLRSQLESKPRRQ